MWNMETIGFIDTEQTSFEKVETDDWWTTDAYLYYKLTNDPRLRWAKMVKKWQGKEEPKLRICF